MKIRYFFSLVFLTISFISYGQLAHQHTEWYPGIVILKSEEVIKGDIGYDYRNDLVMSRVDGKIQTFGPHQALSFQYFEEEKNVFHKFEVFQIQQNSFYTQLAFFEIVVDGKVNYVRKRNRYPVYQPGDGYLASQRLNPHEVAYDYFVEVDGELIKSRKFKKDVLPELMLNEQSLERYMKEKRLKTYDVRDQIVLLNYYNEVSDRTKTTAKSNSSNPTKSGSD